MTSHNSLISELHALLAEHRDLTDRHQATLAQYRILDGDVIEDKYAEYDDARITTAIEASDRLDSLLTRLTQLVGPPPRRTYTLTFAGHERHDGDRPYSFALYAHDLQEALSVVQDLPSFRQWRDEETHDGPVDSEPAIVLVAEQSHPGLRAPGEYIDLRPEQAAASAPGTPSPQPAPASTPPAPPGVPTVRSPRRR